MATGTLNAARTAFLALPAELEGCAKVLEAANDEAMVDEVVERLNRVVKALRPGG